MGSIINSSMAQQYSYKEFIPISTVTDSISTSLIGSKEPSYFLWWNLPIYLITLVEVKIGYTTLLSYTTNVIDDLSHSHLSILRRSEIEKVYSEMNNEENAHRVAVVSTKTLFYGCNEQFEKGLNYFEQS